MSVCADSLEKAVLEKARSSAQRTQAAQTGAQNVTERETEERKETRRALDRLRERVARLFDLYELGQLDRVLFQERMAGLSVARDRLMADLKARPAQGIVSGQAPDTCAAVDGIVKVVVRGKSAQVNMAGGAAAELSLLPECDTTTFGGRLKAWRLSDGLTQRDVSRMLGVDVCSVRNWEAGRCAPRHGVQERVLARLPVCPPSG